MEPLSALQPPQLPLMVLTVLDLSSRMIDPECRPRLLRSAPPAGEILPPVEVTSRNNLAEAMLLLFLFVCLFSRLEDLR